MASGASTATSTLSVPETLIASVGTLLRPQEERCLRQEEAGQEAEGAAVGGLAQVVVLEMEISVA